MSYASNRAQRVCGHCTTVWPLSVPKFAMAKFVCKNKAEHFLVCARKVHEPCGHYKMVPDKRIGVDRLVFS